MWSDHIYTPAILQRVLSASVTVDQKTVSSIDKGVLVFAAMAPGDTEKEADSLAAKVLKLKLWDDESGGRVGLVFEIDTSSSCVDGADGTQLVEEKRPGYWRRSPLW